MPRHSSYGLLLALFLPFASMANWVTDSGSGCLVFAEHARAEDHVNWAGPCENGKAHGFGVLSSSSGANVEGEFREGRPFNARGREQLLALSRGRNFIADVFYVNGVGTRYGSAAQQKSPEEVTAYAAHIANAVRKNIAHSAPIEGNPASTVDVRVDRRGKILSATLVTSSGVRSWDEAVVEAIVQTGSLPLDADQRIPPRLELVFRPH